MSRKPKASKQIAHLLGEENLVSKQSVKGSWGIVLKNPPAKAGDVDSISGPGRPPGEGKDNPLQYSCLENSMDRGATVHEVTKSQMTE